VNWNPIGSSVRRLTLVGRAMADLVREAVEQNLMEEPEVVAGIEAGGMALGLIVARSLGKPVASVRPQRLGEKKVAGAVNPSFSTVEGKKVLIVDTILRMGETIRAVIVPDWMRKAGAARPAPSRTSRKGAQRLRRARATVTA